MNSAGLHAIDVARSFAGLPDAELPTPRYAKGNYFVYTGKSPFTHLVYPLPEDGGLGIHATLDLGGRARFGPNVEWLAAGTRAADLDYGVDARLRRHVLYGDPNVLARAAGRRARARRTRGCGRRSTAPARRPPTSRFARSTDDGFPQVVHLFGIESPGLTASLAIGAHVAGILGTR